MSIFEPIIRALDRHEVRYVVVGGFAVVLHGYARLTADLDLAVDLSPEEATKAIEALLDAGLRPTAPVDALSFADPAIRATWIAEKAMRVFSMRDPDDPMRVVDLFVANPIGFDELWDRSEVKDLGGASMRVASIPDLITMKRAVGRAQDDADVEALEAILRRRASGGG